MFTRPAGELRSADAPWFRFVRLGSKRKGEALGEDAQRENSAGHSPLLRWNEETLMRAGVAQEVRRENSSGVAEIRLTQDRRKSPNRGYLLAYQCSTCAPFTTENRAFTIPPSGEWLDAERRTPERLWFVR